MQALTDTFQVSNSRQDFDRWDSAELWTQHREEGPQASTHEAGVQGCFEVRGPRGKVQP